MLAEEAHYMGEPCYHVVQYYERKRQERFAEKMQRHAREFRPGAVVFRDNVVALRKEGYFK